MTIRIEKCSKCQNIYHHPHGPCHINTQIQEGMQIINAAMIKAHTEKNLLGVVVQGHWLAECDFECKYFLKNKEEL
jgi:hypothetical protein